ncbi:transposase, partial [Kosmotoga arenicorallina]
VQKEFVSMNTFENAEDVYKKYQVYMNFYHNLRPHGSLKYMTPQAFKKCRSISMIQSVKA